NGLTEHEFDHVLMGNFEGEPRVNPDEVADWKWMKPSDIKENIEKNPEGYTVWFKIIFEKFFDYINRSNSLR
ncbi:MAG: NUDIX domain-containing protein, partial [Aurantibacter sp.]